EIQARQILKIKEKLASILAERTGKPLDLLKADMERDFYMSSAEAEAYGLIDQVIPARRYPEVNMNNKTDETKPVKCSFCGKYQEQVRRIVAGPGVYICDECIEL